MRLVPLHSTSKGVAARILRLVVLAIVLAAAIVAAALWWRDRPLAEIERQLAATGGAERALDAADAFLARHPQNGRALALRGRALSELGRWEEASQIFAQVGVHSPEEMRAWAAALVNQRRFSDAMPVAERLLAEEPHDPVTLRHVTICRFHLGQLAEALQSAARLAKIAGHEPEGYFLSGVIHRAQGNVRGALENWERIEAHRPDARGLPITPAEFFLIYGEDLLAEGLPRAATAKLRKSQQLADSLAVQLLLGQAWATTHDADQAAEAWKRALTQNPSNEEARQGLAELALARGDTDAALLMLEPIAASPQVSSATAILMERVHTLLGNEEELEQWQRRSDEARQSEKHRAALKRNLRQSVRPYP